VNSPGPILALRRSQSGFFGRPSTVQSRNFRSVASFYTISKGTGLDAVADQGCRLSGLLMQVRNGTGRSENSESSCCLSMRLRRGRKRIIRLRPKLPDHDGQTTRRRRRCSFSPYRISAGDGVTLLSESLVHETGIAKVGLVDSVCLMEHQ
jgi:hypothetical protein